MSADTMSVKELTGLLWSSGIKKVTDNAATVCLETNTISTPINTVVCCGNAPQACTSNQQQENKMYHDEYDMPETRTETERKADYFQSELASSESKKRQDFRTTYKLDLQTEPLSPKEFIEWIKDGKFTFTKRDLNDDGSWRDPDTYHSFYEPTNYLQWKNPDRDTSGFDTASKTLSDAYKTTERAITAASTGAEMLKALQDFESTTLN